MAQLMPLPLTVSCFRIKSRLVSPFWYRLTRVVLDKGPLNVCVCVCVCACVLACMRVCMCVCVCVSLVTLMFYYMSVVCQSSQHADTECSQCPGGVHRGDTRSWSCAEWHPRHHRPHSRHVGTVHARLLTINQVLAFTVLFYFTPVVPANVQDHS